MIEGAIALKDNGKQAKAASAANARASKQDAKDEQEFKKWAAKAINQKTDSGNIQIEDVRGMKGFKSSWGQAGQHAEAVGERSNPRLLLQERAEQEK